MSVRVVDPDGNPVSGANVRITQLADGGRIDGESGHDGGFSAEWAWGEWYLVEASTVDADARRPSLLGNARLAGGQGTFEIRLVRSVAVRGTIHLPPPLEEADASPVAGTIRLSWAERPFDPPPGVLDVPAGTPFVLHLAPGATSVHAEARGPDDVLGRVVPVSSGDAVPESRLERGAAIRLVLQDASELPFSGKCTSWTWRAGDPDRPTNTTFPEWGETETGMASQGGPRSVLVYCEPRFGTGDRLWGGAEGVRPGDVAKIRLARGPRISGSLIEESGAPASDTGAVVRATVEEAGLAVAMTRMTDDSFELADLPPVPLRISVVSSEGTIAKTDLPLAAGATRAVLVRRPPIVIEGRLVDPAGHPVAVGAVRIEGDSSEPALTERGRLDARGAFRLLASEPGPVRLLWSCESLRDVDLGVVNAPDGDVVVSLPR